MPDARKDSDPSFDALGLDPRLVAAIAELGFERPTGIQADAIGPLLEGRDVVARARTGSGKTAAFGLPLLHRLQDGGRGPRALVVAPTRELASQVGDALASYARGLPISFVTIYGGASYRPQLRALKDGVTVVVGTPGRLIDHLERGSLDLSGVELVVLDEADEMLNMGFLEDVERLLAAAPEERQVALFSATMPPPIRRTAKRYLRDPLTVETDMARGTTVDHVRQRALTVPHAFKIDALVRYLRGEAAGAALVFCRTKLGCGEVAGALVAAGIEADALHGDLAQAERERVLRRLRSGCIGVVVATDVAARGLDVDHITHVVNLDLPDNPESYTHRIGRTGRAGREGTALTLVTPREAGKLRWMSRVLGADFEAYRLPTDAALAQRARAKLADELSGAGDQARAWMQHLLEQGVELEDLAAAALELVAEARSVPLTRDLPDELPRWATADLRPPPRPPKSRAPQARPPRGRGPRRGGPPECELFIGAGRAMGVRPGDLVGALAGETGIAGGDIGRIQVGERSSFVGVSRQIADAVLHGRASLNVRGRDVKLAMARPRAPRR